MNALYRISELHIDELLEACKKLERTNISETEYFQLLKIYSSFQPDLFIEKIKVPNASYSESEYRRLFVLLEEDVFIRFFLMNLIDGLLIYNMLLLIRLQQEEYEIYR